MKSKVESGLVDQTDLEILKRLRNNARETLTRICKDTRIPISSIFDRLKRLEAIGVIKRHTSLVDMRKIGIEVRIFLLLKVGNAQRADLESVLMENPKVNNLTCVNGSWDFVAEMLFYEMKEAQLFIGKLRDSFKGIQISVHHVMEDLKQESFLADQQ